LNFKCLYEPLFRNEVRRAGPFCIPARAACEVRPEVLPWTLSSLIVLYLIWGLVLAPQLAPVDGKPQAERGATALVSAAPVTRLM
jgi:hypothetical protein